MVHITRLSLLTALVALAGCAQLNARVDVLDPDYIDSVRADLRLDRLIRESATRSSVVDSSVLGICKAYKDGMLAIYDVSLDAAAKINNLTPIEQALVAASQASRDEIAGQAYELNCVRENQSGFVDKAALQSLFQAVACPDNQCSADDLDDHELRKRRLRAAASYWGKVNSYAAQVETELSKLQTLLGQGITQLAVSNNVMTPAEVKADEEAAKDKASEEATASVAKSDYLGANGRTLILDDIAFAARKADKEHWARKLNKAKGLGLFGSTDVVLKLESTGDFSVKGMVFDARSTALAARKATLSTLQLLAAGSGMPFDAAKAGQQGDDKDKNAAGTDASRTLAAAKAAIASNELASQHYRAALKRIAAATIAAADKVTTAGASTQSIIDARGVAKSLFEANKPLLQAQGESE